MILEAEGAEGKAKADANEAISHADHQLGDAQRQAEFIAKGGGGPGGIQ